MGSVTYSMGVSLDGYIAGPDGTIGFAVDEELHRFYNEQIRALGAHLCGRRLYETMSYWDTAEEQDPSRPAHELEFAQIWRDTPKLVFSRTLERVGHNATLARDEPAVELERLRARTDGDIAVGGAELASALARLDLIDEYQPVVNPVIHGSGAPFLPPTAARLDLTLVETRTFGNGAVFLRYRRDRG